ncbi:hypothetical protein [Mixta calida]|uniref:hypothetical protein n=1 Tax=Mixta calida TaxID=665913 RepID=UPI0034D47728
MQKCTVKTILIKVEQYEELRKLQERERAKSPLGVAPTIHVIARGLMDKALAQLAQEA